MTHDPDHDLRAMNPDQTTTNGLSDRRLDEAYRNAQRGPQSTPEPRDNQAPRDNQVPWELRGTGGSGPRDTTGRRSAAGPRSGPSTTTRVVIALLLVIALVVTLIGRW